LCGEKERERKRESVMILKINFTVDVVFRSGGKTLIVIKTMRNTREAEKGRRWDASPTVVSDIIFVNKRLQPVILTRNESL
jgi:hypothetical protein